MAASTQLYIKQQRAKVVFYQSGVGEYFTYRYSMPYAQKLTVHKGVDCVLLFEFLNQEEKPINVTGSTFTFRIINTAGNELLLEKPVTLLNPTCGQAKVTIAAEDMLEIPAQQASYSLTRLSGVLDEPVFTDAACGARAQIQIVDSVQPAYVPSAPLTIPTTQVTNQSTLSAASFTQFPGWANPYYGGMSYYAQGYVSGGNTEYFSSFIKPTSALTTIQLTLVHYTGTIKAQFAMDYQSVWYNVSESTTYLDYTGNIYMNVVGWYPLLRLCFNNSLFATLNPPGIPATAVAICNNGSVQSVQITNPGSGYMAPPQIGFIGDGSGAVAEATIDSNGSITGVTVINGGSGYWPIPIAAANPTVSSPVPPANSGAIVLFGTGYIVDMYYR